jgi:hypothetical protein
MACEAQQFKLHVALHNGSRLNLFPGAMLAHGQPEQRMT